LPCRCVKNCHHRLQYYVDVVEHRQGTLFGNRRNRNQSKADRLNNAKQIREKKRAEVIEARRMAGSMPPRVVAIMPLSGEVNVGAFWDAFVGACRTEQEVHNGMDVDGKSHEAMASMVPVTVRAGRQNKVKVTIIPPPADMMDPLSLIDISKCADFLLCLIPGHADAVPVDACGSHALRVLRSMGMPSTLAVTHTSTVLDSATKPSGNVLKERSAAKKRAGEALSGFIPADHYKLMAADTPVDFKQIVRHVTDSALSTPVWRQQRPHVIASDAEFVCAPGRMEGNLVVTGYIRHKALTAQQLIHVPGAGDFQIEKIESSIEPIIKDNNNNSDHRPCQNMEIGGAVIAVSTPEERESLVRENDVDPLDAEQTWPTEEELAEAAKSRKRRLPKGTSDYQAAWIVDEDFSDESESDADDHNSLDLMRDADEDAEWRMDDTGTEFDPAEFNKIDLDDNEAAKAREEDAARRAREADDVLYPDEFELHHDVPARRRLAKYRGLKSFRTSPWDPREDLPMDYARVFAFENFRRAQKRAVDLSNKVNRGGAVGAAIGTYARIHICNVSQSDALKIVERITASSRGMAPPLSLWGLLQHEVKLSVLNFSVKKEAGIDEPIANKEELIFVTGVRTYPARPIYSTDEHGADKHKMERFLHDGRTAMATIYGPITYPPSPLLAFKKNTMTGKLTLVATGSLKSCNPDRVVVKKIVLTGFPVKCHRSKAVVRSMFFSPEDIRWFAPVELWTKHGRRGRIREPLGTHGLFKSIFDGPLSQQDTVCMSLYKRVYPKWPETFTTM